MKKLIAGLFAAAMLAAGLVTVSGGTPATAATCSVDKYNTAGCPQVVVTTPGNLGDTPAEAPVVRLGKRPVYTVVYSGPAGTTATVTMTVGARVGHKPKAKPSKKAVQVKKATKTKAQPLIKPGQPVKFKLPKLTKKGTYKIFTTVTPTGGVPKTTVSYVKIK